MKPAHVTRLGPGLPAGIHASGTALAELLRHQEPGAVHGPCLYP